MKKKLRNIVVDGLAYRWSFNPSYARTDDTANPYHCRDIFTAYAEANYASPLRIIFVTWECAIIGGPLRTGAPVLLNQPDTDRVNLHSPKWAAALIRAGLKRGWQADIHSGPFLINDGTDLLTV
jgi:hypothetical protein